MPKPAPAFEDQFTRLSETDDLSVRKDLARQVITLTRAKTAADGEDLDMSTYRRSLIEIADKSARAWSPKGPVIDLGVPDNTTAKVTLFALVPTAVLIAIAFGTSGAGSPVVPSLIAAALLVAGIASWTTYPQWIEKRKAFEKTRYENALEFRMDQWRATTTKMAAISLLETLGIPERFKDDAYNLIVGQSELPTGGTAAVLRDWKSRPEHGDAPVASQGPVTPTDYEHYCAKWLVHKGAAGIRVTRQSRDGGVDVEGTDVVVQCKRYTGSVSVREVREIHGIASVDGKRAILFTTGTYTSEARKFADRAKVALLELQTDGRDPKPWSLFAHSLLSRGFQPSSWASSDA